VRQFLQQLAWSALLVAAGTAQAAEFADARAYVATLSQVLEDRVDIVEGDLDGDGDADVVVTATVGTDYWDRASQLHLLLRQADGKLVPAVVTTPAPIAGMGCCGVEQVGIENGDLLVQNNAKTACVMETAVHRFRWYRGQWRLLGTTITAYEHCADPQVVDTVDVNVLTGRIERTHEVDGEPPVTEEDRQPVRAWLLADYDFSHAFGLSEP
jgi:hypothetical protein